MKPTAKKVARRATIAAIAVAAVVFAVPWILGIFIAGAVRTIAPQVLGVPVKIERVTMSAISGKVEVRGFEIGNPEGFDTPYLLHADQLLVDVNLRELIRGNNHIEEIRVIAPKVWYHRKLTESNVSALLAGFDKRFPKDDAKDSEKSKEPSEKKAKGKPLVIDHFLFDEGTVGVKVGAGVEVPLAKIELFDLGKEGAFMPIQIVRVILGAVVDSIMHAVTAVAGAVGDAAGSAAEAIGDAAGSLIKAAGSFLSGD